MDVPEGAVSVADSLALLKPVVVDPTDRDWIVSGDPIVLKRLGRNCTLNLTELSEI